MSITKGEGFVIEWNGVSITADIHQALLEGIVENSEDLIRKTIPDIPIESNDLRNDLSPDYSFIKKLLATVGFSLPYALRQHEELGWRHDRTDGYRIATGKNAGKSVNLIAGGKSKFLEDMFNRQKIKYTNHLGDKVGRVLN